jgi:hypothetical protein
MRDSRATESLASRIASTTPTGQASFHVGFDTLTVRRTLAFPDRVEARGYLLLDNGRYALVTAFTPLDVFWQMKAMDILAMTRQENRWRATMANARPIAPAEHAYVGSVWVVDGLLTALSGAEDRPRGARTIRTLHISKLHGLDRVALERKGPRLMESLDVSAMLPALEPEA